MGKKERTIGKQKNSSHPRIKGKREKEMTEEEVEAEVSAARES